MPDIVKEAYIQAVAPHITSIGGGTGEAAWAKASHLYFWGGGWPPTFKFRILPE